MELNGTPNKALKLTANEQASHRELVAVAVVCAAAYRQRYASLS